jgi:7-cyano-7-deazaguanine synthase
MDSGAMRSIVLLSGGLDSTVALAAATQQGTVRLTLTFDYGQRASEREIEAARAMCKRIGVDHEVVQLPWLAQMTRTALVNRDAPMPRPDSLRGHPEAGAESAAAVWVPNRNAVFVSIGAAYAEAEGCDAVVCGFNAEEGATFPDNSEAFVGAANCALAYSTRTGVRIVAPTQALCKSEIVRMGRELDAPLDLVWSCYEGGPEHCLRCESCLRLRRAFEEAGESVPRGLR